jgi:excisionase family DNA binding protein
MANTPEILTMEQAAALLRVSTRTIQRMVKNGSMPGRQVGTQWRFDREQLREWVRGEPARSLASAERGAQRDLIEEERSRLGVDMPETLVDMQQESRRRAAAREDRAAGPDGNRDPADD